jgi:glycosyltransferase involved in cell wall biosynthesis
MKIHAVCIAKNESDIIEQTLISAAQWCDFIYCFDNGSTDGTWEKMLDISKTYHQIIPYKQHGGPFRESLGSEIFNQFRSACTDNDWWCRLDADEIYIDNPAVFLSQVPERFQVIVSAVFNYFFTDKDLQLYEDDPSAYADAVPIEKKCRYYINSWSEVRFYRYREDLIWNDDGSHYPYPLRGNAYPKRIRVKNFQYRSPQQIDKRIAARRGNAISFPHEVQAYWKKPEVQENAIPEQNWKDRIIEASRLYYDTGDGNYVLRPDLMPDLYTMSLIWDNDKSPHNLAKKIARQARKIFKTPGAIPLSKK